VHARLGRRLRQVEDTGDVVQSALVDAVVDLPRFEYRGKGSFLRWLSTIVTHKLLHRARDLRRKKRDADRVETLPGDSTDPRDNPVLATAPSPLDVAAGRELEERYLRALAQLPEPERQLVTMRLDLRWQYGAIAAALSLGTADAVRQRLARALTRLEGLMSGGGP
jgi:RNA polymerase sigma factor (sigma-70 family)